MNKLLNGILLVLSILGLICTIILEFIHFQPTITFFIVSVLIDTLVGAIVFISFKEFINED